MKPTPNFLLIPASLGIAAILTGCAELPMMLSVQGDHGTYSYSAKRGLEIEIHATK